MATKLDQSSVVESHQAKPSLAPKLSIFGTKAGFVIPKNKLPGSLVIRGSSAKSETPTLFKEEHNKHVQRKTKWAPDLALESAVCKGRALAYQVRLDQITKQLRSGAVEMGKIECSLSIAKGSNYDGVGDLKENEGKVQHLELERQEIIGEILRLNPCYKAPDDYKPILKETKIPLPGKEDPGHSVIGVLIGPERNTQKRLQEETGAIVRVYGTKKINGEKNEIYCEDIDEAQDAYEDLHVNVSADSYDKVDAAVTLIELLLAPISVNSAATSTSTISSAVTSDAVNPADLQLIQSTTPQPGLIHYQSHNDPGLSAPQTYALSLPSSMPVSSSLPNNSFQSPVSSFSIPPYTGQSPHMNTMPRNPLPVPGNLPPIPNIQRPPHQFQANPSIGPPFGQPPGIGPQLTPSSLLPPPVRPLQTPHASGGWPSLSPVTSQSQRPPQASPSFMPVRPPISSVSPLGAASPQYPIAMMPPSNTPTHYRSQHPQVANTNPSATLLSRPPAQSFPSVPPQGPSSMQALPFPAGASVQSPYPLPMQVRPTMSTPDTLRGASPAFSQVGSTPGMIPSSIGSSCPPSLAPANTNCSQASGAAWRPPRPAAGDFTFRPVISPSPTPEFTASGSQMEIPGSKNPGLPHAPFFHPGNQGFQRPHDGRPMGQPWMHAPPPVLAGAFPRNQFPAGFHPAVQQDGRIISPMPAASNMSNFLPSRPFHLVPRPQQNPFVDRHMRDENPIYDPFAPTEASGAKKTEVDAEYEDFMASVGVK